MISNANKIQNDSHCVLYMPLKDSVTSEQSKGKSESHTVTNNGSVAITTVGGKPCASFNGVDQYLSIPSSVDFKILNDFNIFFEFNTEVRSLINGYNRHFISIYDGSNIGAHCIIDTTTGKAQFGTSNLVSYLESAAVIDDGVWHQYAVIRRSGVFYFYLDGVLQDTGADSSDYNNNAIFFIGCNWDVGAGVFDGYLRNLSIHKGIARHNRNFTPQDRLI